MDNVKKLFLEAWSLGEQHGGFGFWWDRNKSIIELEFEQENEAINHELKVLLAILHGDGGHYQEKHGTLKAIIDAKELINKEWIRPMEDKNLDEL